MKKIAFVLPVHALPVPNKKGGAVETLLMMLLMENEKHEKYSFVFISPDDEDMLLEYNNSKCYLCSKEKDISFDGVQYTSKMIQMGLTDTYAYDCKAAAIARFEQVDYVIMEGAALRYSNCFEGIVSKSRMAIHLHHEFCPTKVHGEAFSMAIAPSLFIEEHWKCLSNDMKTYMLPNAIQTKYFGISICEEERMLLRQAMGFDNTDFVVLYCGRLIAVKGVLELVEAICSIENENIKLLLIGTDSFGNGNLMEYAKKVLKIVDEKSDRIKYLGYIENNKLPQYYQCADVQVIPSICEEAVGMVALEGMLSGLPLIITNSGGLVENVPENVSIKVHREENLSQQISDAIMWMYKHDDERCEMKKRARKHAEKYTEESYYLKFCEMMEWWKNEV